MESEVSVCQLRISTDSIPIQLNPFHTLELQDASNIILRSAQMFPEWSLHCTFSDFPVFYAFIISYADIDVGFKNV